MVLRQTFDSLYPAPGGAGQTRSGPTSLGRIPMGSFVYLPTFNIPKKINHSYIGKQEPSPIVVGNILPTLHFGLIFCAKCS